MRAELLRAVLAAPDDDAPRAVYADALLQAGDPRGEFIALQLAGAGPAAATLLATHREAWLAALPHAADVRYERGFASHALLRDGFLDALDLEPIHTVALTSDDDDPDPAAIAARFAADPRTARLRSLDVTNLAFGAAPFAHLLSADLRALRELRVGDDDCHAYAIAAITRLAHLTTLAFHGDASASLRDAIPALAGAPSSAVLESLTLSDCDLRADAGHALARSPYLDNLRSLSFSGGSYAANRLGDDGAIAVVESPNLRSLTTLSLVNNGVSDAFLARLATPDARALTSLAVNGCTGITSAGLRAYVESPRFATLQQLWVGGCRIDDAGIIALATSPHATALRALNLHGNPLTAAGARALAASSTLQLDHLAVSLTPEIEAILRPRYGARLNRP